MLTNLPFECQISATDTNSKLQFEMRVNDQSVFKSNSIVEPIKISYNFQNDEQQTYRVQFIMSGKESSDTILDDQGNIVNDVMLTISNIFIDDIDINQLLIEKAEYTHDFNGSQDAITDKFYGNMGCNGTVTFEFTTPFYLWLLEHM